MNITKDDAAAALRYAGQAGEHSQTLFNYEMASPYLLLWGVLWVIAGIVGVFSPQHTNIAWLIVNTVGIVATGYLVACDSRRIPKDSERSEGLRYGATVAVLTAFLTMTFLVFAPVSGVEVQTFITILIAAIYMILGLWTGYRLAVIGLVLAILVTSAFFYTPAQFPLMVSILGGAALILGGLWMRRA